MCGAVGLGVVQLEQLVQIDRVERGAQRVGVGLMCAVQIEALVRRLFAIQVHIARVVVVVVVEIDKLFRVHCAASGLLQCGLPLQSVCVVCCWQRIVLLD